VEDLDAQLATTLVNFVSSYLELENTLHRAKAEMDAAAKAAQVEARKKNKTTATKTETTRPTMTGETEPPTQQKQDPPKPPGLFDAASQPSKVTSEPGHSSRTISELSDDEEEILAEISADAGETKDFTSDEAA